MVVYKITNIITDKVYIGSSRDFPQRKKTHIEDLFNKRHHNRYLQKDFDKLGITSFVFEIIKTGFKSDKHMLAYEYELINSTKNVYNILKSDFTTPSVTSKKNGRVVVQKSRILIVMKKKTFGEEMALFRLGLAGKPVSSKQRRVKYQKQEAEIVKPTKIKRITKSGESIQVR